MIKIAKVSLIFSLIFMIVAGLNSAGYAEEKRYPNRPVQIIVALRAGGGVDLFFRLLSEELTKLWKVPVTVVNEPSAMGATASSQVANAKKDGSTFLGFLVGPLSVMAVLDPSGPINVLRDFDPLFVIREYSTSLLAVRGDSKFHTLKDVMTYANEKPGDLILGVLPIGTESYLAGVQIKRLLKGNIRILPHQSAELVTQILGGHLPLVFAVDIICKPYIDSGRMRAFVSNTKSIIFPNILTFAEMGYPEVNMGASMALLGPKGLPPSIRETWESALKIILKDPKFLDSVKKLGYKTNIQMDAEKNREFYKGEIEKYKQFTPEELGWK